MTIVGKSLLLSAAAAVTLVGPMGCGADSDPTSTTGSSPSGRGTPQELSSDPAPSNPAPPSPGSITAPAAPGCAAIPASEPPLGAAVRETVDLDGDGERDQVWLGSPTEGPRTLGATFASGGSSSVEVPLVGPVPLEALTIDVDEQASVEVLVSDHRAVLVYVIEDCRVRPVTGTDGDPYVLDLGFRGEGTGVGCVDADLDGRRDLVRLFRLTAGPDQVEWSRTIVRLDGATATDGPTDTGVFTEPADHAAIGLLSSVSCGANLITDGVTEPRA